MTRGILELSRLDEAIENTTNDELIIAIAIMDVFEGREDSIRFTKGRPYKFAVMWPSFIEDKPYGLAVLDNQNENRFISWNFFNNTFRRFA